MAVLGKFDVKFAALLGESRVRTVDQLCQQCLTYRVLMQCTIIQSIAIQSIIIMIVVVTRHVTEKKFFSYSGSAILHHHSIDHSGHPCGCR